MARKRLFRDRESRDDDDCTQRKRSSYGFDFRNMADFNKLVLMIVPMIRTMIGEVLAIKLANFYPRTPLSPESQSPEKRMYRLHIMEEMHGPYFTNRKISVKIRLLDATTMRVVTCGPLASMRVCIVPLQGDFDELNQDDWTAEDFNRKIMRQRMDKPPLMVGDLTVTLKDGVGESVGISFTDNSKGRTGAFRIGVKAMQQQPLVREGVSGRFRVKDKRGEPDQKRHPPHENDNVCYLKTIRRNGKYHTRLESIHVRNVGDLLRIMRTKPETLREVVAACFDGQTPEPLENLNGNQRTLVEEWKEMAYKNESAFVRSDKHLALRPPNPFHPSDHASTEAPCPRGSTYSAAPSSQIGFVEHLPSPLDHWMPFPMPGTTDEDQGSQSAMNNPCVGAAWQGSNWSNTGLGPHVHLSSLLPHPPGTTPDGRVGYPAGPSNQIGFVEHQPPHLYPPSLSSMQVTIDVDQGSKSALDNACVGAQRQGRNLSNTYLSPQVHPSSLLPHPPGTTPDGRVNLEYSNAEGMETYFDCLNREFD